MARPKKKRARRKPGPKTKRGRRNPESSSAPMNPKEAVVAVIQNQEARVASLRKQLRTEEAVLHDARRLMIKMGKAGL